jgi:hypothetical protein
MQGSERPLLAVWGQDTGRLDPGSPYLRVAIWENGRVLFAPDPKKWSPHLQQGWISKERVKEMKKRIAATGVFQLKRASYLVPDAPVYCLLVNLGTGQREQREQRRERLLYWDEVESPGYGANIDPNADYLKFKACWKGINQLAQKSRPRKLEPIVGRFGPVPPSWYPKLADRP